MPYTVPVRYDECSMLGTFSIIIVELSALLTGGLFIYGAIKMMERAGESPTAPKTVHASTKAAALHSLREKKRDPLLAKIAGSITGDATEDAADLTQYSRDTSIFARMPRLVVFPKNAADVQAIVRIAALAKQHGEDISVTGRSAGTDMSGGPLTTSIVAVFTKYMNKVIRVGDGFAITEPGAYYRDFEKKTLAVHRQILPSYPASRELAAMGGIVNNNSGGERSLEYGKTEDYIQEVEVVLSDGSLTTFKELTPAEVEEKKRLPSLEGSIYKGMSDLVANNKQRIMDAKPKVSKNSAGYGLWNIVNPKTGGFNLAKVITGAQGTLALNHEDAIATRRKRAVPQHAGHLPSRHP